MSLTLINCEYTEELVGDVKWMDQMSCTPEDTEMFFSGVEKAQLAAKAICRACVVRGECLDYALKNRIDYGVWGGLNEDERKERRRRTAGFILIKNSEIAQAV